MKKLLALTIAGMFSLSAAAYACDGMKNAATKGDKAETAKKDTKDEAKAKS